MILLIYLSYYISSIMSIDTMYLFEERIEQDILNEYNIRGIQAVEISYIVNYYCPDAKCHVKIINQNFSSNKLDIAYVVPKSIDPTDCMIKYTISQQKRRICCFVRSSSSYDNLTSDIYIKEFHEGKVKVLSEKGIKWLIIYFKKKRHIFKRLKRIVCIDEGSNEVKYTDILEEMYNKASKMRNYNSQSVCKLILSSLETVNKVDAITLFHRISDFINYIKNTKIRKVRTLDNRIDLLMNNRIQVTTIIYIDESEIFSESKLVFLDTRNGKTEIFLLKETNEKEIIIKNGDFNFENFHKVKFQTKKGTKIISKDITSLFRQISSQ